MNEKEVTQRWEAASTILESVDLLRSYVDEILKTKGAAIFGAEVEMFEVSTHDGVRESIPSAIVIRYIVPNESGE